MIARRLRTLLQRANQARQHLIARLGVVEVSGIEPKGLSLFKSLPRNLPPP